MKSPSPPKGLSPGARQFWRGVQEEYAIVDPAGLALLEVAARAWARLEGARMVVDAEGAVVKDRWGQSKPHPAANVERDARSGFLAALRALQLDVEPLKAGPGRPGGR